MAPVGVNDSASASANVDAPTVPAQVADAPQASEVRVSVNQPVNHVTVSFKGLKRVSPYSLIGECEALGYARTLGGVQWALQDAQQRLAELNILKSLQSEVSLQPDGVVDIAFTVEEMNRQCTVSANVDKKGDLSCDLRVTQPALLGGPLSASASIGATPSKAKEFLLRVDTPRLFGRRYSWSLDASRATSDEREASGYTEDVTGIAVKLSSPSGAHSITAEAAQRDLHPAIDGPKLPSMEIQQAQHTSIKTSLRYSASWVGQVLSLSQSKLHLRNDCELAGLFGDASFLRDEVNIFARVSLPRDWSWNFVGGCGLLLTPGRRPTFVQDRFFLGGASGSSSALKGFLHRGLGPVGSCMPRDASKPPKHLVDALGGDFMWSAFTSIAAPIHIPQGPKKVPLDACVFGFLGLGAVALPPQQPGLGGVIRGLRNAARASVGVGLGVPLPGMGQLELTFAYPFWAQSQDRMQRVQLGLRLETAG